MFVIIFEEKMSDRGIIEFKIKSWFSPLTSHDDLRVGKSWVKYIVLSRKHFAFGITQEKRAVICVFSNVCIIASEKHVENLKRYKFKYGRAP